MNKSTKSKKHYSPSNLPWGVVHNPRAGLCPWEVMGPDGLVSGCNDERSAKREANRLNDAFCLGYYAHRESTPRKPTQPEINKHGIHVAEVLARHSPTPHAQAISAGKSCVAKYETTDAELCEYPDCECQ